MSIARKAVTLAFACLVLALAGPASARAAGAADANEHVETRLLAAVTGVGERESVPLGLYFRLAPGWKIYWRSPGDAGFPPQVDWTGSKNLGNVETEWPAPKRFSIFGLETLGYTDEVVLPLTAMLARPGEALHLEASVSYLACKEICIPYMAKLAFDLPAGPAAPSQAANLIARYTARVPGEGARHGLAIDRVAATATGNTVVLEVEARSRTPFDAPDLYVEGPEGAYFGRPEVTLSEDGRNATMKLTGGGAPPSAFEAEPLTLTLVDGPRAMEKTAAVRLGAAAEPSATQQVASPVPEASSEPSSLVAILMLALLGGLILNLMPCVLPVLSLKLLSVVGHGGSARGTVRLGFIASAAGIVFSFLLLAGFLVVLKAGGMAVGWGIQFQQPVFLVAMTAILVLFACNMLGLFEVGLPGVVADFAARQGGAGSYLGHFLTGAFATLLATPCSAPFLGTAVGFALSRGPADIFAVFTALGLGLAAPYLLVSVFPGLATRLPRPGAWMTTLRRVLAAALAATAVWLLWVLAAQIGPEGAVAVGFFMVLAVAVLAVRRLPGSRLGRHAGVVTVLLLVGAVAVSLARDPVPTADRPAARKDHVAAAWRSFDAGAIGSLVADGKTVFVDVTADWCITCQVNKKLVLDTEPVAARLSTDRVVAMQADWTRPDSKIADYLASFGRYGIPFNVVYGPAEPQGIVLSELLTAEAVLDALREAGGDRRVARP